MMTTSTHLETAPAARIDPDTALGPVRLTVADARSLAPLLRARDRPAGHRARRRHARARRARRARADRAAGRQPAAAPEPARAGPLPPGDPPADAARPRLRAGPPGPGPLAARRRLRPPGQRGALPVRPGRQRDRDLPGPPARGVAAGRRPAPDVDAAARPRRRRSASSAARRAPGRRRRPGRGSGTSTCRCPISSEAEAFYHGVLGFDVMVRGYPGALFVSAGGYHHHIGLNTWHSAGAAPAPAGSVGLRSFTIELPTSAELARVLARVAAAGIRRRAATRARRAARARPVRATASLRDRRRFLTRSHPAPASLPLAPRRRGGVATQRPAKPSTPVRFRSSPLARLAGNGPCTNRMCPRCAPRFEHLSSVIPSLMTGCGATLPAWFPRRLIT